ncbi:hypothetical protein [Haloarcula pelagica]|uniref:hypothetical protein n=1 Tax=Haloarcula pelagica TaxID=3033389 RepID=UPI0024C3442D|nr:hypothetical protein [Halomicroarcula sp. YJ-61-S]
MTSQAPSQTVDADELLRHLDNESNEGGITLPVSINSDNIFLEIDGVRGETVVLGLDRVSRKRLDVDESYILTAEIGKFAIGSGGNRNYLICNCVHDVTCMDQSPRDDSSGDQGVNDETENKSRSTRANPFSGGKKIRTDREGERVSGKNPFADPDRLKETGIHQGGI